MCYADMVKGTVLVNVKDRVKTDINYKTRTRTTWKDIRVQQSDLRQYDIRTSKLFQFCADILAASTLPLAPIVRRLF